MMYDHISLGEKNQRLSKRSRAIMGVTALALVLGFLGFVVGLRMQIAAVAKPIIKAAGLSESERERTVYYLLKSDVGEAPVLKVGKQEKHHLEEIFNWEYLTEDQLKERLLWIHSGKAYVKVQTIGIFEGNLNSYQHDMELTYERGKMTSLRDNVALPESSSDFLGPLMKVYTTCEPLACEPLAVEMQVGKEKVNMPYLGGYDFMIYLTQVNAGYFPIPFRVVRKGKEVAHGRFTVSPSGFLKTEIQ